MSGRHPKNKTGLKTMDRVAADERVEEVWSERDGCFGSRPSLWVSFLPGFAYEGASIHEPTVKRVIECIRKVSAKATE